MLDTAAEPDLERAGDPGATDRPASAPASRKTGYIVVAGLVALLAAVAGALLPARQQRSELNWPGASAPGAGPSTAVAGPSWTPALLADHQPSRMEVGIGCAALAALDDGDVLFATDRTDGRADGVTLARAADALTMRSGLTPLATVALDEATDACPLQLLVDPVSWSLTSPAGPLAAGSFPAPEPGRDAAPVVGQLYTDLAPALVGAEGLSVRILTEVGGSRPAAVQWVSAALVVGALAALAWLTGALALGGAALRRVPRAARWLGPLDAALVAVMALWWVVGPTFYDDGWVFASADNFRYSGTFSSYYDTAGAVLPTGFAFNLVMHAMMRVSRSMLWLRLPSLAAGVASWFVLRAFVTSSLGHANARRAGWALAVGHLVFFVAWGSTLRPEPVVALCGAVALLAAARFRRSPDAASVTVMALTAGLALSLHPAGVVVAGPAVASVPEAWRWARRDGARALVVLAAAGAAALGLAVALLFADSDLHLWRLNRALFSDEAHHALGWRDEPQRYQLTFGDALYGTMARRASVLVIAGGVVLYLVRRRRLRPAVADIAALSLGWGAAALLSTPSKWPWHLAALAPFAAATLAVELERRVIEDRLRPQPARVAIWLGAVALGGSVATHGHSGWAVGDLFRFVLGEDGHTFWRLDLSALWLWAAAAVAVVLVGAARSPDRRGRSAWWSPGRLRHGARLAQRSLPVLTLGAIAVLTVTQFAADAVAAPGWSVGRQNLGLAPGGNCGLGDQLRVADFDSAEPLAPFSPLGSAAAVDAALPAALRALPALAGTEGAVFVGEGSARTDYGGIWGSFIDGDTATGTVRTPWFALDGPRGDGTKLGFLVAGTIESERNLAAVQFARRSLDGLEPVAVVEVEEPVTTHIAQVRYVDAPTEVDLVRLIGVDARTDLGGWLALSAPRLVEPTTLTALLRSPGTTALIAPQMRTMFPCARAAPLHPGVADVPDIVITDNPVGDQLLFGPFGQLPDVRPLDRMAVDPWWGVREHELRVFRVPDATRPGTLVPVERRLVVDQDVAGGVAG